MSDGIEIIKKKVKCDVMSSFQFIVQIVQEEFEQCCECCLLLVDAIRKQIDTLLL